MWPGLVGGESGRVLVCRWIRERRAAGSTWAGRLTNLRESIRSVAEERRHAEGQRRGEQQMNRLAEVMAAVNSMDEGWVARGWRFLGQNIVIIGATVIAGLILAFILGWLGMSAPG